MLNIKNLNWTTVKTNEILYRLKIEFSSRAREDLTAGIAQSLKLGKKTIWGLAHQLEKENFVPRGFSPKLIYGFLSELIAEHTDLSEYQFYRKHIERELRPLKIKTRSQLMSLLEWPGIIGDKCRSIGSNLLIPVYFLSSKSSQSKTSGGYGNMSGMYHESAE